MKALRDAGAQPIVATRTGGGRDEVAFDFCDKQSWQPALTGVTRVFLLRPPQIADIDHTLGPFITAARAQGVQHIVFLSVAGAEKLRFLPHAAVERHLTKTTGWTILRPGFFAQNIETAYGDDIRTRDRIYIPAGDGKSAFVDVRDIGKVAADCLLRPELHHDVSYELTGPVAATFAQVAQHLSLVLGRKIRYEPASVIGYFSRLHSNGEPMSKALIQTALHVGLRFGQAAAVSPDLSRLIAERPRDVFEYIDDCRDVWQKRN